MADLSDVSPELQRFIARRMAVLDGQDWRSLDKDGRQAHLKKARQILAAERAFLARGGAGGTDDADGDDDADG